MSGTMFMLLVVIALAGIALFVFWLVGPPKIAVQMDVFGIILSFLLMTKFDWRICLGVAAVFLIHGLIRSAISKCPHCKQYFCYEKVGEQLIDEGTPFTKYRKVKDKDGFEHQERVAVQNNVYEVFYKCKKCGYETSQKVKRQEEA